jgi:UDP-N-acetylglucosamine 2-epimerase (non-hydrolysing)
MPEEINRIVTDSISDYLFVSEESGVRNLRDEGVEKTKIFFVGNVMIDSLEASRRLWAQSLILDRLKLAKGQYGVVTLHRPSNVDDPKTLTGLMEAMCDVAARCPLVFPVHPRTKKALMAIEHLESVLHFGDGPTPLIGIHCLEPMGYLDFMALVANSRLVLTDSGGLQEETTVLGVPCLTLRENTERPVTVTHGTNRIIGSSPMRLREEARRILDAPPAAQGSPPLWDGHAADRIVNILLEKCTR